MDMLVDDVLLEIARRTTCSAISSLGNTCKYYNRLMKNEGLWRHLIDRDCHNVGSHNIGETYLQQYKYLCHTLTPETAIETAIRANRMDAVIFVLKQYLDNQVQIIDTLTNDDIVIPVGYVLKKEHIQLALEVGNLEVLRLPPIMNMVTDKLLAHKTAWYIPNIDVLEWLSGLGRITDQQLLHKIVRHDAITETHLLSIVPWFINRGITLTSTTVHLIVKLNYKKLYLILHDKGFLASSVAANACCKLGYLDMLEILKGLGIMPTAGGLYLAYTTIPQRPYILQWLKHNNVQCDAEFVTCAVTRDDAVSLDMFGRYYNYTLLSLLNVVQHDCVNIFQWMQRQNIVERFTSKLSKRAVEDGIFVLSGAYFIVLREIGVYDARRILKVLDDQGIMNSGEAISALVSSPQRASSMLHWAAHKVKLEFRQAFLTMVPGECVYTHWLQQVLIQK